jgi:hypothetical protein
MSDQGEQRTGTLWPAIISLEIIAAILVVVWVLKMPNRNQNTLAIAEVAKAESVDVVIQSPIELDFLSKSEIYQLRREAVEQYPQLYISDYAPSKSVFGQIVDGLPWWGLEGQFFYGNGEKSISGPSEESRFLLNPYLLVAADFYDDWRGRITADQVSSFPLTCLPRRLRWYPPESRAEVTYDAACVRRGGHFTFGLIAYNGRDWHLDHLYVSYPDSLNITKSDMPTKVYPNPQYIHQGNSCGYPGGCNNMSPYTPEISHLVITALPAKTTVWLWEHKPTSTQATPDMVFELHFR